MLTEPPRTSRFDEVPPAGPDVRATHFFLAGSFRTVSAFAGDPWVSERRREERCNSASSRGAAERGQPVARGRRRGRSLPAYLRRSRPHDCNRMVTRGLGVDGISFTVHIPWTVNRIPSAPGSGRSAPSTAATPSWPLPAVPLCSKRCEDVFRSAREETACFVADRKAPSPHRSPARHAAGTGPDRQLRSYSLRPMRATAGAAKNVIASRHRDELP